MRFEKEYYFFLLIPILHLFFYQIYRLDFTNPKSSLKIFKSNNLLGVIILFNILINKI